MPGERKGGSAGGWGHGGGLGVVPESPSAGVGEGVITAIVEGGQGATPLRRVVGADTYTPLAGAALLVLPGDADVVAAAEKFS